MTSKTVAAYSGLGTAPPFMAVNDFGDRVEVTVRGPKGPSATISLPVNEFLRVFTDALNNYGLDRAKKPGT